MANLITNRKASHNFQILEKFEAGISLQGTEVKSCRARNINCMDAYAKVSNNEVILCNVHISPYDQGNLNNHEPCRERKLLLHKSEIRKLKTSVQQKGLTLVPLNFHLSKGRIKVELGICRGKGKSDKRESLKKKQHDREIQRAMK